MRIFLLIACTCLLAGLGISLFDDTPNVQTLNALVFGGLAAWALDSLIGDRLR